MNSKPYFQISPDGTINVLPKPPNTAKINYSKKLVQFAVHRNPMGLEIHGENFSTVIDLSTDDALSIIMMLAYEVREAVYTPAKCEFVEASK